MKKISLSLILFFLTLSITAQNLSDKDIKELLRNDNIMKIVKEYCSSHKWRESFKRRIWNLL